MDIITDSKKADALALIDTYLNSHGRHNGQFDTAIKISQCLRKAIEAPSQRSIVFKIGHIPAKRTVFFSLQIEGGPVIIGKIPGQEL
jgi:hypothetical protein